MILKNLSRSNGGSGQLVKYIFRYIFRSQGKTTISKKDYDRPLYLPKGVILMAKDIHHLRAEKSDTRLLADIKEKYPSMNFAAYYKNYILPQLPNADTGQKVQIVKDQNSPFIIKHNMRANSLNGFIREFESNERGRIHKRSNQTTVHHTIISFSNKDSKHINEKLLRDMSKEYIRLRGGNNMYVGTVHLDREHIHLHVAMGGTTIDGKSSRISKKEFEDVKIKLQEYQLKKYPELSHSLPEHGKAGREKNKEEVKKIYRNERASEKESILKCIETNFFKAQTTKEFIALLNENGYKEYYRGDKLTGIQTEHYKYRFTSLGLNLDLLHKQDQIIKRENDTLKEIRQARGKENKELRKSIFKEENTKEQEATLTDTDSKALQELTDIRAGRDNDRSLDFERDSITESDTDSTDEQDEDAKDKQNSGSDTDEDEFIIVDDDEEED